MCRLSLLSREPVGAQRRQPKSEFTRSSGVRRLVTQKTPENNVTDASIVLRSYPILAGDRSATYGNTGKTCATRRLCPLVHSPSSKLQQLGINRSMTGELQQPDLFFAFFTYISHTKPQKFLKMGERRETRFFFFPFFTKVKKLLLLLERVYHPRALVEGCKSAAIITWLSVCHLFSPKHTDWRSFQEESQFSHPK